MNQFDLHGILTVAPIGVEILALVFAGHQIHADVGVEMRHAAVRIDANGFPHLSQVDLLLTMPGEGTTR